jgi:hypothetical protein
LSPLRIKGCADAVGVLGKVKAEAAFHAQENLH